MGKRRRGGGGWRGGMNGISLVIGRKIEFYFKYSSVSGAHALSQPPLVTMTKVSTASPKK